MTAAETPEQTAERWFQAVKEGVATDLTLFQLEDAEASTDFHGEIFDAGVEAGYVNTLRMLISEGLLRRPEGCA